MHVKISIAQEKQFIVECAVSSCMEIPKPVRQNLYTGIVNKLCAHQCENAENKMPQSLT